MFDPEILLEESPLFNHGKKSRYKFEGKGVPSVTELLSFIDSEGLVSWANRMGKMGIDNRVILDHAAEFGTLVHEQIEYYLKGKPIPTEETVCLTAFKQWWSKLNSCHKVKIKGQEQPIVTKHFAGTYDLLLSIDGKPYLIDFKTSNHVGYKYFMQLAAYRYLLYHVKNVNIQGCVILQFDKKKPQCNEYALDFSNDEHFYMIEACFRSFMGLVYTYYNTKQAGRCFRSVFTIR